MQVYVALLRGINVGTSIRISMKDLKNCFELIGLTHVVTYIQSGNVVFHCDIEKEALTALVENALMNRFNASIKVVLRTQQDIASLCLSIPPTWLNDEFMKTDVFFVMNGAESNWMQDLKVEAFEDVLIKEKDFVWRMDRTNQSRSGQKKLMKLPLYKVVTIRNINTVRALYALMTSSLS